MTRPVIGTRSPGPLANIQPTRLMSKQELEISFFMIMLYDRKRPLLIYRTHKIMIPTSAHESIHQILSMLRLFSKWKKDFLSIGSAHSEMVMKFVKK